MYYSNDLNSLSVLSLYEGDLIGVVDKLYFDKKLKKLLMLELIAESDTRLNLVTKNIYHIGKNAITLKNNQAVALKVESNELTLSPIGSKAYTIKGEYLGVIKDISLSDKFITEKFLLDNNSTIDISLLASCGKNTVIFYDQTEKVNVGKFTPSKTPKIFKSKKVQTATVLPIEEKKEESPEPKDAVAIENAKTNQQSTDFLIGRICTKDIYNFNNELLIKANAAVTKKNLKEINRFGKLRELMLYSK